MRSGFATFFIVAITSIGFTNPCLAQHGGNIAVESCYSNILVDKSIDWSKTKLRYSMLALWNREIYEQAQASNALSLMYSGAKLTDSYEQSNQMRLKELYEKNESLDYDRETASARFFLDPQAGKILKDCLDAKVRAGYGFSTEYYLDDERTATLELIWNWAPDSVPLRIHTTNIRNATVVDDGRAHPKHLLPTSDSSGWETLNRHDKLVTLRREDLEREIVINIETDPDVRATHIVIPVVPKKQDCKASTQTQDAFGQEFAKTLTSGDVNGLPRDSDDGHGHKFVHWTIDIAQAYPGIGTDGIVSGVSCSKGGTSLDYYEVFPRGESSGSLATCKGWFENAGKLITMNVSWFKKGYVCTDIAWPALATTKTKQKQSPTQN